MESWIRVAPMKFYNDPRRFLTASTGNSQVYSDNPSQDNELSLSRYYQQLN